MTTAGYQHPAAPLSKPRARRLQPEITAFVRHQRAGGRACAHQRGRCAPPPDTADCAPMRRLRGLRDLVHDAIEQITGLVQETQEASARTPVELLAKLPGL